MARTKRIPMHFPYQGPQPETRTSTSQEPATTVNSQDIFDIELTSSAEKSQIEFYQHPHYLHFLADHAPGINTAKPQMGTENLTVDQLKELLFAAIPNGFREESIEFEEPFMTKDGEYPIPYRHPDSLEPQAQDDPGYQDLLKLMVGLEAGVLAIRDAVEGAIAIYASDKVAPELQEKLYKVQNVITLTWAQLGQRLRKLSDYESIWADKVLQLQPKEVKASFRPRRSSRLTETSDDEEQKKDCYCRLFSTVNESHVAGETGKFIGPQIMYGTEKYLRALDQGIRGSYAAFQIATTIKVDLGVSTWMHHHTPAPSHFVNLYASKALPGLRIFFKVTQIRDWECRHGIGSDPADSIMSKMEAGEDSSDDSDEDRKAIREEVRRKIADRRKEQTGVALTQEEADAILQHKMSFGLRENPSTRIQLGHEYSNIRTNEGNVELDIQAIEEAADLAEERVIEDSQGESAEEDTEPKTSPGELQTMASAAKYGTLESQQWLIGKRKFEDSNDSSLEDESEDESGDETEEYIPPKGRKTKSASSIGQRSTSTKRPRTSTSSKGRGRGRPPKITSSLATSAKTTSTRGSRSNNSSRQAQQQTRACKVPRQGRKIIGSSSSDIDELAEGAEDCNANGNAEDDVGIDTDHGAMEDVAEKDSDDSCAPSLTARSKVPVPHVGDGRKRGLTLPSSSDTEIVNEYWESE